ncbi:unnamed protein product [Polarella glacialis]|uniref:ABC transporter domain-containing protein n=1 Tax=Polarella glacialis TaxID=89957 RepID=A0A813KAX8_POLGL|nr:unnamed protein product [Polarella glacialis]
MLSSKVPAAMLSAVRPHKAWHPVQTLVLDRGAEVTSCHESETRGHLVRQALAYSFNFVLEVEIGLWALIAIRVPFFGYPVKLLDQFAWKLAWMRRKWRSEPKKRSCLGAANAAISVAMTAFATRAAKVTAAADVKSPGDRDPAAGAKAPLSAFEPPEREKERGRVPCASDVSAAPKAKAKAKVPVTRAEAARQAVLSGCPADVEEDVREYMADTAAMLFEEENIESEAVRRDLEEAFLPLLEECDSVSAEEAAAFCVIVFEAGFPDAVSCSKPDATAADAAGSQAGSPDYLCHVPNLMLMYGGSPEPLLRGATLELLRGHRYGVVGTNGSGKTTLMARLASKDIAGLTEELRVVHLRHEAILQGVSRVSTARDYVEMHSNGLEDPDVAQALRDVGFENEEQLGKAVLALSGGWQMRLALACAMAKKANLLLLDEPTNHLDADGVRWLVDFINRTCVSGSELGGGAAMIVSHDPAFLDQVCTDVIHFSPARHKGKLTYHPGTFSAFKAGYTAFHHTMYCVQGQNPAKHMPQLMTNTIRQQRMPNQHYDFSGSFDSSKSIVPAELYAQISKVHLGDPLPTEGERSGWR